HLGQIYEKLGRRDDAIRLYALALNAERPDAETHDRLVKLAGSRADDLIRQRKNDLLAARTIALNVPSPGEAAADFFVVLTKSGVEGVRFVKGDERLRGFDAAIRKLSVATAFPDDGSGKILRRATVACTAGRGAAPCTLTMQRLEDMQ